MTIEREASEQTFHRNALEHAPDAMIVVGDGGVLRFANVQTEVLFGHTRDDLVGRHYSTLLPDRYAGDLDGLWNEFLAARQVHHVGVDHEVFGLRSDGSEFPLEISLTPVDSPDGTVFVASIRDVSDRRRGEEQLRDALSLVNATLESTADGILVVSAHGSIAGSNEQFAKMWGIPTDLLDSHDDERLIGFVLGQLVDPGAFIAKVTELYAQPDAESLDILDFIDGRTFERYSRPQRIADQIVGRVWSFRDITSRRQAQEQAQTALSELAEQAEQLKRLAFRDSLTGLANRAYFQDQLERALAHAPSWSVNVLLLDLDDFKEVNDVLGHQAGDDMLIEVGRRLLECVGARGTVARLGGDEFVILLTDNEHAEGVAARVVATLNAPVELHGRELHPSVSVGIAANRIAGMQASDVLRRADIAMYAAKASGKNCFLRFRPDMMSSLLARTDIESGLREAVALGEIVVHYQPIVNVATGCASQVEALVRWARPEGLLAPADFIPAAESSGMINQIGREVLRQACDQLGPWLAGDATRSVAVNVSAVQLREQRFAATVLEVLDGAGVDPNQLIIEVTESAFLESGQGVIDELSRLRERGARVSLDDFGTGYSSLGRLQELPVDIMKVDRSFVTGIRTGDENLPILNSMMDLAHNLGLHVTAEGVETEVQAAHLQRLGVDSMQGFLFARPAEIDRLCPVADEATATFSRINAR